MIPIIPSPRKSGIYPQARVIIEAVADEYEVPYEALIGASRRRDFTVPRQEAYLRCIEAGMTTTMVGRVFCDRDHTTIIQGCQQARARRAGLKIKSPSRVREIPEAAEIRAARQEALQ